MNPFNTIVSSSAVVRWYKIRLQWEKRTSFCTERRKYVYLTPGEAVIRVKSADLRQISPAYYVWIILRVLDVLLQKKSKQQCSTNTPRNVCSSARLLSFLRLAWGELPA